MKIKLIFYLFAVGFVANFVAAKNEQKRRRPILDATAQDTNGNYVDQIALDTVNYPSQSQSLIEPSENYPASFFTGSGPALKKSKKQPSEQKVQYITPETYSAPPRIKENYPSYVELNHLNRTKESRRPTISRQKQKVQNDYTDYNYYFPDSKRLNTKTPAKASTSQNSFDKFSQPQSADAVIHKEVSKNGDELTYHYYYPSEESTQVDQKQFPSSTISPSSTFSPSSTYSPSYSPSSTRAPSLKQPTKKKINSSSFHHTIEHTSTDPYQYPPVLQRPNEYDLNGSDAPQQDFYPTFENTKIYKSQSTLTPSTSSPIKMLKPTKKNNYYLPSSTTAKPMKIRRPSTETQFQKFSLPPSVSTTIAPHYSTTTRAPELYKYSTASPISSTTLSDFYIKPSTQTTPTISSSSSDLYSDGSSERTIVIRPKVQYTAENYEQQPTVKERIVYKFVEPQEYYDFDSNKTEPSIATYDIETAKTPEYYRELNTSTQADMDFYNSFHKNYNYEYFTEQDAGRLVDDGDEKIDRHSMDTDVTDDKQRASKKNMVFAIAPDERRFQQSSIIPVNVQDHEIPPPMTENDDELTPEASKNNQYFVLYSLDEDNRRERKQKKKVKQEPEVVYHHHHHQHEGEKEYEEGDFQQFDSEFDSEFDSDLVNSDNVRIVDPNVRGGRPLEFTKDDYLRHIKQAVVQYMKTVQNPKDSSVSSSTNRVKSHRYQESNQDSSLRPTKASIPASIISSTAGYKSTLGPQQYKPMAPVKLPKNFYTADKLKDAIDDMQESPQVDLTLKKAKVKPFDLSAIDVGQTYQHVTQFDHSAALKNVEEFDQSNAMTGNSNRQKLHFSQQTYHDINNLGHNNHKQKLTDDNDNENTYKGYVLPNKYGTKLLSNQNQNTYSAMNYDSSKLPRIVSQNNDDDDEENKVDDTIDAPIQIINGIPVANPYNIDLNTLKYMLGGIAQAEVNDQIRDLDESSTQKFPNNWKAFAPVGSFTSNNPIYQVYGQQKQQPSENPPQKSKKNQSNSSKQQQHQQQQQQQQNKFPLVGTLVNFNKPKNSQQNKQRNNNNQHQIKNAINIHDYSNWSQINKKQRTEPQASQSQNVFVVRPMIRNKHARDDKKPTITRFREPARDMRPPPPLKPKQPPQQIVLARIK